MEEAKAESGLTWGVAGACDLFRNTVFAASGRDRVEIVTPFVQVGTYPTGILLPSGCRIPVSGERGVCVRGIEGNAAHSELAGVCDLLISPVRYGRIAETEGIASGLCGCGVWAVRCGVGGG